MYFSFFIPIDKIRLRWASLLSNLCALAYLCWRRLSCRLKYFPQISHEYVTSGLLWVRSWIMRLYDFVKRLWQYLQMNSHLGRIFRRKSDRQSSSIRITANILPTLLRHSHARLKYTLIRTKPRNTRAVCLPSRTASYG